MGKRLRLKLDEALQYAVQLHKVGELSEARMLYRDILSVAPEHPDALHFVGVVDHQMGDSELGIQSIKRCLEVVPDHPDAINNLGNIYRETGRLEESEECYRKVLELSPKHVDTLVNMGIVLRGLKQLEQARETLEQAVSLNPQHARAFHNLGNVYRDLDRFDDALSAYACSEKLDPLNSDSARSIAKLLFTQGRKDDAIEVLKSLVKLHPDDSGAIHQLASYTGESIPKRATDQYVRNLFDNYAQRFDRSLARLEYRAPQLVGQRVIDELGSKGQQFDILDIGCGTGLCGPLISDLAKTLVGVDLSRNMLAMAEKRGIYDRLVESELTEYMKGAPESADVIVCVDTFVYFGDLREAFSAASIAARPGASFLFTVEQHKPNEHPSNYWLHPHGRYSHTVAYLREALNDAGFEVCQIDDVVLRLENQNEVRGALAHALRR